MNSTPATPITPTLHPLCLPYKTQHRLLTMIQSILEECCFSFGRLWLPEVLKARSCECVESIELTRWTRILIRHCKDLPSLAITEIAGASFRDVLLATHPIRHTAVHRRLASVCEIEKMIENAVSFTVMLKDSLRTRKIEVIRNQVGEKLEELKRVQKDLEMKMLKELAMKADKRLLLDRLEKEAIEVMVSDGSQNRWHLGSRVDELLIRCQTCTDLGFHHPEEMGCAEIDDATPKIEDWEGTSSSIVARTLDQTFHHQVPVDRDV